MSSVVFDAAIAAYFKNGPTEVGIASGSDSFHENIHALSIYQAAEDSICSHSFAPEVSESVRSIVRAGIGYLVADRRRCEVNKVRNVEGAAAARFDAHLSQHNIDSAVTCMIASKINYWGMNHHTGQRVASGYFAKVCNVFGIDVSTEANLHALWKMCHWANTLSILSSIGIKVKTEAIPGLWPAVSRDVTMRVGPKPAGTAKLWDCITVVRSVSAGIFARLLPKSCHGDILTACAESKAIEEDPARYHVGSMYLTGQAQIMLKSPSDHLQSVCVTFCQTLLKDHSIAQAHTLARIAPPPDLKALVTKVMVAVSTGANAQIEELVNTLSVSVTQADVEFLRDI